MINRTMSTWHVSNCFFHFLCIALLFPENTYRVSCNALFIYGYVSKTRLYYIPLFDIPSTKMHIEYVLTTCTSGAWLKVLL